MSIRTFLLSSLAVTALAATPTPPAPPATDKPSPAEPAEPPQARPPTPAERAEQEKRIVEAFRGKDNFTMSGKVIAAQGNELLLEREGLPPAFLIVPGVATVQLDGKKATLADLKPGTEVRATFNLAQQYPIAIAVDAKGAPAAPTPAPANKATPTRPRSE